MDSVGTLEERIQLVLNGYRPNLYMDGGDVEIMQVDEKGDCPRQDAGGLHRLPDQHSHHEAGDPAAAQGKF